jgi:hypothetical protein
VPLPSGSPADVKGKLVVKLSANPPKATPGSRVELVVTFSNKSKEPLPLTFRIDPAPRFELETFNAKGARQDLPKGPPPPLKAGLTPRVPGEAKGARVTLAAGGNAKYKLSWEASKMRWAPEKLSGTPPERGYPRAAAAPLGKGKYSVRVVTPLLGIAEGPGREVSAPKIDLDVAK